MEKNDLPAEVAFEIIREDRGKHFDPDMVDVFLENTDKVYKSKLKWLDPFNVCHI